MGIFGIAKKGYGMLKKANKLKNSVRAQTLKEALGPVPRAVPSEGQKKKQVKDFVDIRKRTKSTRQKKKFK
jgi:hypothetical protein